jgi:hypothetical protein
MNAESLTKLRTKLDWFMLKIYDLNVAGEITAFCWEPKGGHPDEFVEGGLTVCKRGQVRGASKGEELNVSKSSPLYSTNRTSMRRADPSLMGQERHQYLTT